VRAAARGCCQSVRRQPAGCPWIRAAPAAGQAGRLAELACPATVGLLLLQPSSSWRRLAADALLKARGHGKPPAPVADSPRCWRSAVKAATHRAAAACTARTCPWAGRQRLQQHAQSCRALSRPRIQAAWSTGRSHLSAVPSHPPHPGLLAVGERAMPPRLCCKTPAAL
jgi:hypothetical protein